MTDRVEALRADVVWNVDLGRATPEIEAFREKFLTTNREVADSTLRTTAAQGRLDQALARHGPQSRQAATALLNLRKEEQALANEAARSGAAVEHGAQHGRTAIDAEERSLGRLVRGSIAGSGIFRGLGRQIAFASSAFLGGVGLVSALRTSIKAAEDHQVVIGQLEVAVHAAGLSFQAERGEIEKSILTREKLGFTEEQTVRSYITLVRATKDVATATRLQAIAADIARARNVPLETATNAVAKAVGNQGTALKRLIPGLDSTAKGYKLIEDAQRRTAGAAEKYATSAAGAQARFDVALHHTEVAIGTALLPQFTRLLDSGAKWLDQEEHQKRVAHDVQRGIHLIGEAGHYAHDGIKAVDDITGGFTSTLKILIGLKIASVLRGWSIAAGLIGPAAARSFVILGASADAATAKVVSDAARMEAALDAATRPRTVIVTTTGGGLPGGGGIPGVVGGGGGKPGVAGRINEYGRNAKPIPTPGTAGFGALAGLILSGFAIASSGSTSKPSLAWDEKTDRFHMIAFGDDQGPVSRKIALKIDSAFVHKVDAYKAAKIRAAKGDAEAGYSTAAHQRPATSAAVSAENLDRRSRIDLNLSRARARGDQPGILRALSEQVAFDARYIAIQERLLKTDVAHRKQHAASLQRLYADQAAAQAEIDSIHQKAADDAARAQAEAARKRDKAAHDQQSATKKHEAQAQKNYEEWLKENTGRVLVHPGVTTPLEGKVKKQTKEALDKVGKTDVGSGPDIAEFLQQFAALQKFRNNFDVSGGQGNITVSMGKAGTHIFESVTELRQIKHHLERINASDASPASAYSLASSFAAGG